MLKIWLAWSYGRTHSEAPHMREDSGLQYSQDARLTFHRMDPAFSELVMATELNLLQGTADASAPNRLEQDEAIQYDKGESQENAPLRLAN
jgi:hypothetical protein